MPYLMDFYPKVLIGRYLTEAQLYPTTLIFILELSLGRHHAEARLMPNSLGFYSEVHVGGTLWRQVYDIFLKLLL